MVDNVKCRDAQPLTGHVDGNMADAAAGIHHLRARWEAKSLVQLFLHFPQRRPDGEGPPRAIFIISKVSSATEHEAVANARFERVVV